ncbi:hypothetical protein OAH46_01090 [Verrucomicrobia bacterium]|nr:hypothetical protein [Verrucomicrobiota bacterium]
MLIPVVYTNGKHDLVKDFILNRLIEDNNILSFKRTEGWISLDSGKLRGKRIDYDYDGPRRRTQDPNSELDRMIEDIL